MDAPSVGFGQNDAFAYQARAFLEEVAGIDEESRSRAAPPSTRACTTWNCSPRSPTAANGVPSPHDNGKKVSLMKLGVYNAVLHDRPLPEALKVIAGLGLTGIEINSGGFLPAVHIPTFDEILVSDAARDDYLGHLRGHRRLDRRPELQRQPAAPQPGDRRQARRGHPTLDQAGQSPRPAPGRHHVRAARRRTRANHPNWVVNAWNSAALDVLDYQWAVAADFWKDIDRWPPITTSRSPSNCTRRTWCSTPPTCSS